MSSPVRIGNDTPLMPHSGSRRNPVNDTPAPGHYDVASKHNIKFTSSPAPQFGGNLCKIDRDKTGLRASSLRKKADPGPAAYSTSAGQQNLEAKRRAPTYKFGSSERGGDKIYMHRHDTTGDVGDPNRASAGRGVPGPGAYGEGNYKVVKNAAPIYSFGLKATGSEQGSSSGATNRNIGPGAYQSPSSVGKQLISSRPTSPGFSMGTCDREKMGQVLSPGFQPTVKTPSPGPSKYECPSGVGRQVESKKNSANAFSFGSDDKIASVRDKRVPGPGAYDQASMLGIQSHSKFTTYGGFKFGTGSRPPTGSVATHISE